MTLAIPPCWENFWGSCPESGLCLGTRVSNLKSVALTVLELLAFNAQKFRGSRDPGYPSLLGKFLGVMSGLSLGRLVSNLKSVALTVIELLAFNSMTGRCAHTNTQTDRHTSNEHIISAIHFVHLAEIIMNVSQILYLDTNSLFLNAKLQSRTFCIGKRLSDFLNIVEKI